MRRCIVPILTVLVSGLVGTLSLQLPGAEPAAGSTAGGTLSDSVLHHLLHAEPNWQLQVLGNVRDPLSCAAMPSSIGGDLRRAPRLHNPRVPICSGCAACHLPTRRFPT